MNYNGLIADIRDEDLAAGIAELSSCSHHERERILRSAEAALEKIAQHVEAGRTPSAKMLQDAANDIGLWFANETIEGRAEQYKAMVQ